MLEVNPHAVVLDIEKELLEYYNNDRQNIIIMEARYWQEQGELGRGTGEDYGFCKRDFFVGRA